MDKHGPMMATPIDILLATYNGAQFLVEQIESLLGQSHGNIHLIIRDDASTDGTGDILLRYTKKYPSKIRLLPTEKRLGILGNFSSLMKSSTADYILFADQDDIWDKDKVALTLKKIKELEVLSSPDSPLLVHTDLKVVDGNANIVSPSFWRYTGITPSQGSTLNRLLMQNVVTGCATMINRPLLELAYPIPEAAVMHDWWLSLVAAAFGHIGEVSEATIMYRQHGKNALGAKKQLSFEYIKQGIRKLRHVQPERAAQAQELLERYAVRLTDEQKALINAYIKLPSEPFLKRTKTIFKYKLYRMGLFRNLVGIFLKT